MSNFIDEFNLLTEQGNLGFYTSCEVTHAVILDREMEQTYNYYTVFVFEERQLRDTKPKNLSDKLIPLSRRFSLAVMQYQIELKKAGEIYEKLVDAIITRYIEEAGLFYKFRSSGLFPSNSFLAICSAIGPFKLKA